VTADFNHDGHLDLATANANGDVDVMLGDGQGGFAAIGPANGTASGDGAVSLAVADFNHDGNPDLAMVNPDPGGYGVLSVLWGNGDGTFRTPTHPGTYWVPLSAAVGDFNGDGNSDLVVSEDDYNSFGYVEVLYGNGLGDFTAAGYSTTHPPPALAVGDFGYITLDGFSSQQAAVGDFTGDGLDDLVIADYGVSVEPGRGDGTFNVGNGFAANGTYQTSVAVADFNADGHLDAVTSDVNAGTVSMMLGVGDGNLRYTGAFAVGASPTAVAVGDFNGDGRTDVAAANGGSNTVSVLLNDGDWPVQNTPWLRIDDATVVEGNAGTVDAVFTVSRSGPTDQITKVDYSTADNFAVAGSDYRATSGTLTFAPGETSKTITVVVNGDRLPEWEESYFLNLSNATNATIADGQGLGFIVDDEPYISVSGGGTVVEGNSGTKNIAFTVTLSASYDLPVTVTYATADGTATAGSDYQAASGTLTFAPGETSKTISVLVKGDRLAESNESFLVNLSGATYATINQGQATCTIMDDEPRISISDVSKFEGRRGQTTLFTFTVTLSAAYDQPVTMSFKTTDGTAKTSDNDYVARTGTLTFAPGETTKTITIEVKGDSKKEANETFYLDLFGNSSNSWFTRNRGIGTILNDD
jgi:hypothetical protein